MYNLVPEDLRLQGHTRTSSATKFKELGFSAKAILRRHSFEADFDAECEKYATSFSGLTEEVVYLRQFLTDTEQLWA